MPRAPSPATRRMLVDRAAEMLARREPVTLRSLVSGTGVSTMAVYTYFDGMPGLWRAVRQEGFGHLGERLAAVPRTRDAVHDLVALGVAYVANALAHPALYRTMFDAGFDLEDPAAADRSFGLLIECAARARDQGRFAAGSDPQAIATRWWAVGHGLTMLVLTGVLPVAALSEHAPAMGVALFVGAGDDPDRCRRSVRRAWRDPAPDHPADGPGS